MKKVPKNSTKIPKDAQKLLFEFPEEDFPLAVNIQNPQRETFFHWHDFDELVIINKGNGIHIIGEKRHPIYAGDVLFIPPGECHSYTGTKNLQLANILFRANKIFPVIESQQERFLLEMPFNSNSFAVANKINESNQYFTFRLSAEKLMKAWQIIEGLNRELKDQREAYRFYALSMFFELIGFLCREFSKNAFHRDKNYFRLSEVISYMQKHFREKISISELGSKAAMSRSTFFREFKKATGSSPVEYLNYLRIFTAMNHLLSSPDSYSIKELSLSVGIQDSNYFCRLYKKYVGETPRQTRKLFLQHRQANIKHKDNFSHF